MLDSHPELTIPPETHFFPVVVKACRKGCTPQELVDLLVAQRRWGDFKIEPEWLLERLQGEEQVGARRAMRTFYEVYADRQGKPRWGDKTPGYAKHIKRIDRVLPESRFIHMIRDGRDAALSRGKRAAKPSPPRSPRPAGSGASARRVNKPPTWTTTSSCATRTSSPTPSPSFAGCAIWSSSTTTRRCSPTTSGAEERMAEMHRDLPAEGNKKHRAGDLRMRSHALTRQPLSTERIARWKQEMPADDNATFESVAGDLLSDLGYEVSGNRAAAAARGLGDGPRA